MVLYIILFLYIIRLKMKQLLFIVMLILSFCSNRTNKSFYDAVQAQQVIQVGAERTELYLPKLRGKRVGLIVNQTSRIADKHLVDYMLSSGIKVQRLFCPEHGFRGSADNGAVLEDDIDALTQLPIISLYGKKKKPAKEDLEGIDMLVFDIQDVGVRFYTYISTLHYVMEAAAENGVELIVLDRPNPNIHYIDGPILDVKFSSFVGMHPVPVVYGMTIGEYAGMINGEGWLKDNVQCKLDVIPCHSYNRSMNYILPVKPSPNLASANAIAHYPSLCFFEPTSISIGRGTPHAFELIGQPGLTEHSYSFTPMPRTGASNPKHEGQLCFGESLIDRPARRDAMELKWLIKYYALCKDKEIPFFTNERFFDLLAGSSSLREQLIAGLGETEIRASWEVDLREYDNLRKPYMLYPD